jgi:uncharacterized protein YxjI
VTTRTHTFSGLDLSGDLYTVEQSLLRSSKYEARDASGQTILTTKEKRFSIKDRFPFKNAQGEDVFEVVSASMLDFDRKRDYLIVDAVTDEEVVVLDKQFSMLSQKWSLRAPETSDVIATIESSNQLLTMVRSQLGALGNFLPRKFDIKTADGSIIGSIQGQLSLNDVYDIELRSGYDGPREAIIAAAMIIDAVEEN